MDPIKVKYEKKRSWGISASIDLHSCNPKIINNRRKIREFVIELCRLIKVKRFGKCFIYDFGEEKRVRGISMMQLIETSLVSGHFSDETNRAYLDIFSCKYFNPNDVAEFCKIFFDAKKYKLRYHLRI